MRVLVVEDEVKMAGLLRRGLVEEGLAVDVAGSGEDALVRATATGKVASISPTASRITPIASAPRGVRATRLERRSSGSGRRSR